MPTLVDLFCGAGGWTAAALARGWRCVGYDVTDHGYPGRLVARSLPVDVAEILRHRPALVVASPPCEDFARACLPWLRTVDHPAAAIELLKWAISLVDALPCPVVVECSRFAARYVDGARFAGSYALWGDLPALLPDVPRRKQRYGGRDRVKRAMNEPALSTWIVDHYRPRRRRPDNLAPASA
jgi:hypothetical protein